MTLIEAEKERKKYDDLIGEFIDDYEISDVLIVPSNRKFDTEIINRTYWNKPILKMPIC